MDKQKVKTYELTLPSGKIINFRAHKGVDKVAVLQSVQIGADNYVSGTAIANGYLACKCIATVDGVENTENFKRVYDNMAGADLDFYVSVFAEMFLLNEQKQEDIKAQAAFLLKS